MTIIAEPGRGFVELVENDLEQTPEADRAVAAAMAGMLARGADQIVLGCTHYPFLIGAIRRAAAGRGVTIIDPAPAVARRTAQLLDARGLRLHDLCAAHFEAVPGHKAVQRHVLAFERRGFVAVLRKNAAERRAQQAFARAAHRALHHDAPCPAHASTSRIIFNSCSFSFWVRTAVRYHVSSSPG